MTDFYFDGTFSSPGSDVIASAWYDADRESMLVKLKDQGLQYVYYDVPQSRWDAFNDADSKGKFFANNVKDYYTWDYADGETPVWRKAGNTNKATSSSASAWDDVKPSKDTRGPGGTPLYTVEIDPSDVVSIPKPVKMVGNPDKESYGDGRPLFIPQADLEPVEILVTTNGAPSAGRYTVNYFVGDADGFDTFEATANDEVGALVEFNDIVARLGLNNVRISSVVHHF